MAARKTHTQRAAKDIARASKDGPISYQQALSLLERVGGVGASSRPQLEDDLELRPGARILLKGKPGDEWEFEDLLERLELQAPLAAVVDEISFDEDSAAVLHVTIDPQKVKETLYLDSVLVEVTGQTTPSSLPAAGRGLYVLAVEGGIHGEITGPYRTPEAQQKAFQSIYGAQDPDSDMAWLLTVDETGSPRLDEATPVAPPEGTETVVLQWSTEKGACSDCGLPAAFRRGQGPLRDDDKLCAICAANEAADGDVISRLP